MQAAADTPDASDVVEEVLHPTFEPCTTEAEWQLAATSTGALNIVDPNAWVLINECVYNAYLYELPLCRSMVDPESGPRRIDCADGRREIEWTFVNDTRPNGLICAEFFQVICPDGLVHNVPLEAFSEEEAVDLLCT